MSPDHRRIGRRLLVVPFVLLLTCAGVAPLAAQGTFNRTGDTTIGRNVCRATVLNDGRVLVTGGSHTGDTGSVINKEAEIYDPNTSTFSATGSMTMPRIRHAAVALADGRVLVLGGQPDPASDTASAELFDPAAGTFTATGNMMFARENATATLLKDGRVLVVGGTFANSDGTTSIVIASEIYDPAAGTFAQGALLSQARVNHTAVGLPDGRVLVLGGAGINDAGNALVPLTDIELFDPATAVFSTVGHLNESRQNPSATVLPDGKVVVAGGAVPTSDGQSTTSSANVEVFDPSTGTSTTAGTMSEGRVFHAAVALADGRVLLAGGTTGNPLDHSTASADLFDPSTGKITAATPLAAPRTQAGAVRLLDGSVLIVGGARLVGGAVAERLQTAEIFKP